MSKTQSFRDNTSGTHRQRGVVLFFALVALVAMSLAAVALIRSVDTGTIIAGNIAFKQSATRAGDGGVETAIAWLGAISLANGNKSILEDPTHHFNITDLNNRPGYFSNVAPDLDLFDVDTWDSTKKNSQLAGTDPNTGVTVRFVVQRMCRLADQPAKIADCMFGGEYESNDPANIKRYDEVCVPNPVAPCNTPGQSPLIRITARAAGPRNSVSYVQAFVY